jgi:hypothetical protein
MVHPASLDTYEGLQFAILNWLARADDEEDPVVDTVRDFITLAEARINSELRVRQMIERVAAPVDEVKESMPARFLEPISASIILASGRIYPLKYVTAHELSLGSARSAQGDPQLYSIVGGELMFAPVITFDDTVAEEDRPKVEIIGYFSQPALGEGQDTNDILKFFPNIYLYGSLLEATAFVSSDQITTWAAAYQEAVDKANALGQASQFESMAVEPLPDYAVIG